MTAPRFSLRFAEALSKSWALYTALKQAMPDSGAGMIGLAQDPDSRIPVATVKAKSAHARLNAAAALASSQPLISAYARASGFFALERRLFLEFADGIPLRGTVRVPSKGRPGGHLFSFPSSGLVAFAGHDPEAEAVAFLAVLASACAGPTNPWTVARTGGPIPMSSPGGISPEFQASEDPESAYALGSLLFSLKDVPWSERPFPQHAETFSIEGGGFRAHPAPPMDAVEPFAQYAAWAKRARPEYEYMQ